jgi:hypothetical protein
MAVSVRGDENRTLTNGRGRWLCPGIEALRRDARDRSPAGELIPGDRNCARLADAPSFSVPSRELVFDWLQPKCAPYEGRSINRSLN